MVELVVPEWTPTVLRYGTVGLVAPPGVGKFLGYADSVALFTALGIPAPQLLVPVVGLVELGAVVLLLLDEVRWLAALSLVPVVFVALWTTGEWQAAAVLVAAVALLAIEHDALDVAGADGPTDSPDRDPGGDPVGRR